MVLQDRTGDWWIGTEPWPVPVHESRDDRRCHLVVTVRDLHDPRRSRRRSRCSVCSRTRAATCGSERLVGDRFGLSRWQRRTGTFHHYTDADGLPRLDQFYVASFAEDRAGHVWIGFSGLGGLARHQDGRFVRFTTADGAPAGRISNLLLDSKGRMWAATDRVWRLPDRRTRRGAAHVRGLHHGAGSVEQHRAAPWSKTPGGASTSGPAAASTASIRRRGQIRHYTSADGVPTGATARGARPSRRAVVQRARRPRAPGAPDRSAAAPAAHPHHRPPRRRASATDLRDWRARGAPDRAVVAQHAPPDRFRLARIQSR